MQISPELRQAAANELLARRRARRDMLAFAQYTFPDYTADPFHIAIAEALDAVIAGDLDRLMIFAPPQHGKSHLVSVDLPAKWLGDRPNDSVILTSYGAALAHDKSRQVRDIVEGPEFRALYGDLGPYTPRETRDDSRAVNKWSLSNPYRGSLLASGAGGPITGQGGLLGIIDDPFASWAEAQSVTIRNKVWDWYRNTFRTRIREGGAIVLIMTRWHADDLAGRLLQDQGDRWTVLRFPAIAEDQDTRDANHKFMGLPTGEPDPVGRAAGEPLAPSHFSIETLVETQAEIGSQGWAAEYQQVPRALEGERFKRSWFAEFVSEVPHSAKRIRYWDKAGTKDGGAYSAGVLVAKDDAGFTYIEDVVRGQWSAHERETIIKQTAQLDAQRYGMTGVKHVVEQEPGSGGKESAENTIRNLAGYLVAKDAPTGDKDTRLEPFAAQCEAGNVRLKRAVWNQTYIEEMVAIPNGSYRDQADATAGAFNLLHIPKDTTKHYRTKGSVGWKRGRR